jgi:hypothetical protein
VKSCAIFRDKIIVQSQIERRRIGRIVHLRHAQSFAVITERKLDLARCAVDALSLRVIASQTKQDCFKMERAPQLVDSGCFLTQLGALLVNLLAYIQYFAQSVRGRLPSTGSA